MGNFETASDLGTEGGYTPMERPTSVLGQTYMDGVGRDAQTDARKISEVESGDGNIMDDRDLDDTGWQCYSGAGTIAGEIRSRGWEKTTVPSGAMPNPLLTSGGRGAEDIGAL